MLIYKTWQGNPMYEGKKCNRRFSLHVMDPVGEIGVLVLIFHGDSTTWAILRTLLNRSTGEYNVIVCLVSMNLLSRMLIFAPSANILT